MNEESPHVKRLDWEDLPAQARSVVESLVGRVSTSISSEAGLNSQLASTLHTPGGKVFVKALPSNHKNVTRQKNEAATGPSVHEISPTVLHHVDTGQWNFLVFEHFDGRHANLTPGSPDLAAIPPTLRKLLALGEHDKSASLPVEERWARLGDDLDLSLLAGESLVHTDPNRQNILIGEDRTVLVDWSMPGRGASWLNIAFMISALVSEGHPPRQAQCWAEQFDEWRDADQRAIDTFLKVFLRRRKEQAMNCPESRRVERLKLAYLTQEWLSDRG